MNLKSKLILLCVFIIFWVGKNELYSQSSKIKSVENKSELKLIPSLGISYQNQFQSEFSMIYGLAEKTVGGAFLVGIKGGVEFNYDKNNFIIAPKVGFEFSGLFCLRLSVARFSRSSKSDYYVMPEIGLGAGICNLTYGYNVLLTESTINNIGKHRISITINIF